MKPEKTLFIGGYAGTSKKDSKPFYTLHFAKEHDYESKPNDNMIGWDNITVFVEKNVFDDFKNIHGGVFILASLVYIRGGWGLIDYSFK